jgi:RNA polymerase sigma-70 factor, ECF subfamily
LIAQLVRDDEHADFSGMTLVWLAVCTPGDVSREENMQTTQTYTAEQKPTPASRVELEQQFDITISRSLPAFRRMAFRKLRNTADAEDAVQDALLAAYAHLDQFNGGARMSTWMTTIVINCARMQLRARSRHVHFSLDEPFGDEEEYSIADRLADSSPTPEEESRSSELREHVNRLLRKLSPILRRAFELRDMAGLTTREAALILNVPEGTVKAQLARARAQLRELMMRTIGDKYGSPVKCSASRAIKSRLMAA